MNILLGTVMEVVLVEAVTLEGVDRTVSTEELGVYKGDLVTTPTPPTSMDIDRGTTVRTVGKEVGWRKLLLIGRIGNVR